MFVSQSGTTLSMKLGRANADEKKNKIEMEFESRMLILGEFRTVSQVWFHETKKTRLTWYAWTRLRILARRSGRHQIRSATTPRK